MATATPFRIPWRAIVRSANIPSTSPIIALHPATVFPSSRRQYASQEISDFLKNSSYAERMQFVDGSLGEGIEKAKAREAEIPPDPDLSPEKALRLPRAVQAAYLRPLRRQPTYGVPTCDLQLRSYSIRNLEFFADFALRAAYYLGLPAYGPVPLPRIMERWTVPRGSFIHKKSQENFERKTVRRLIQIKDGEAEAQELWLAFLRKHAYYGIGMKANVWEFTKIGVGKEMDAQVEAMRGDLEKTLGNFAFKKDSETGKRAIEVINRENFRMAQGGSAPMAKR
ncbi:hypothetical protein LZ554_007172 [Drepanopeziza brunnea f. sp. 'monogermtubi']|nr:hypothetical protein LZ554_007172 [Drepanopeziza brunnea f. sp. 'monogermtubi']